MLTFFFFGGGMVVSFISVIYFFQFAHNYVLLLYVTAQKY